ncbi:uncharacterized protein KQ657_002857 [Scheffersomyces spartinae]|uniref:Uncharacterized protein n=1 Tax=Scheffersomyces spartinae TaxID=45513 RepID=A0A9P7V5F9_9ASCO|nr:uncharacterized protein KQ657_002857 [Scheffersomyces spartinae]KAG7191721.1 hypothetical protein KQ657_002857 [Scheffersomyces spartinae]
MLHCRSLRSATIRRLVHVLVDDTGCYQLRRLPLIVTRLKRPTGLHAYSTLAPSDFEIDLITLKRVPVTASASTTQNKLVSFEFDFGKEIFVQDKYEDFYNFLKFASPSHGDSFNSLVAKVDEYALQKGANIELLQRMKHDFTLIEQVNQYFEIARNNEIILYLQQHNLEYLMPELKVLAQEFDFGTITLNQLIHHLDGTLAKFEIEEDGSFDKTPEFFQILIQCTRYKSLREIIWNAYNKYPAVDTTYGDKLHLLSKLVTKPEHSFIQAYPREFEDFINENHRELLALILGHFSINYQEIDTPEFLAGLQTVIDDVKGQRAITREVATKIRDGILYWSGSGVINNFQDDIIREVVHGYYGVPTVYTQDALENYEINVIQWLFGNDSSGLRLLKRLDEDFIITISQRDIKFSKENLEPSIIEAIQKTVAKVLEFEHTVNWGYDTLENFITEGASLKDYEVSGKEHLKGFAAELREIKGKYLQNRFEFGDLNLTLLKIILNRYLLEKSDSSVMATVEGILAQNPQNIQGVLEALDNAIIEENKTSNDQISLEIQLENFISQLNELARIYLPSSAHGKFGLSSSNEILSAIRDVIAKSNKDVNELVNWNKLHGTLAKVFSLNNNHTSFLDTFILSGQKLDKRILASSDYVQLPDDFRLDQFVSEIANLKDYLAVDYFSEVSSEEILNACETLVAWESPRTPYMNLHSNLINLFKMNNNHTEVLDSLLISQSVFDAMEQKLSVQTEPKMATDLRASFSVPTIKVDTFEQLAPKDGVESASLNRTWLAESGPDMTHDIDAVEAPLYAQQLLELRSNLDKRSFYKSTNQEIFEVLNSMIENCSEEQAQSKLNLRKLCYNMNGANLSNSSKLNLDRYLDGVNLEHQGGVVAQLIEELVATATAPVEEVESEAALSLVGENAKLLNQHFTLIRAFLIKLSLWDKKNWGITVSKFQDLLSVFEEQLDKLAPNYANNLEVVSKLNYFASKIDFYPDLVQQLCEVKSFNPKKELSVKDVEEAYKVLMETSDYEAGLPGTLSAIDAKINEQPFEYNDSEKLLALLTKNENNATLQDNDLFNHMIHEHDIRDYYIKDAVSATPEVNEEDDKKILYNKHPRHHHGVSKRPKTTIESPPKDIDMSSIEDFLETAKQKFETAKDEQNKVREAYQWSKSSIATGLKENEPLGKPNDELSSRVTPLFPTFKSNDASSGAKYLLLSVDGHKIESQQHPMGTKSMSEDIFEVLGKFRKEELDSLAETIEDLQLDSWRIVGSKVEPKAKYLVWEKVNGTPSLKSIPRGSFRRSIKNVFAGIGVILASLIGINYVLDDSTTGSSSPRTTPPTTTPTTNIEPIPIEGNKDLSLPQMEMAIAEEVSKMINEATSSKDIISGLKKILWK